MLRHRMDMRPFVALMLTSATLFATSALAQSQAPSGSEVTAAEPSHVRSEIETLKAENAIVRELLQKMEQQQKALLDQRDP